MVFKTLKMYKIRDRFFFLIVNLTFVIILYLPENKNTTLTVQFRLGKLIELLTISQKKPQGEKKKKKKKNQ